MGSVGRKWGVGTNPRYVVWRDKVLQKLHEAVCRHCLQILTTEAIKIWQFRTIHLLILDQLSLTVGLGLSDILGSKPPSPCLAPQLRVLMHRCQNIRGGARLQAVPGAGPAEGHPSTGWRGDFHISVRWVGLSKIFSFIHFSLCVISTTFMQKLQNNHKLRFSVSNEKNRFILGTVKQEAYWYCALLYSGAMSMGWMHYAPTGYGWGGFIWQLTGWVGLGRVLLCSQQ